MGKHRPEPAEGLGRDARTELGDVALQIGGHEVPPPAHARRVVGSEEAVREAAAKPQAVELVSLDLIGAEDTELDKRDPSGERLP